MVLVGRLSVGLVLVSFALVACGSGDGDGGNREPERTVEQAQHTACTVLCIQGYHLNGNCQCVPDKGGGGGKGEMCGTAHCPSGQVCCNASCGICTAPGDACIQIACN